MTGYRINDDLDHVLKIINGLNKKEGHCPCRLNKDASTLCPCDEFVNDNICKCKLFVKLNDGNPS